eukprot:4499411-Alexandrium_andersonii.AAC.1
MEERRRHLAHDLGGRPSGRLPVGIADVQGGHHELGVVIQHGPDLLHEPRRPVRAADPELPRQHVPDQLPVPRVGDRG